MNSHGELNLTVEDQISVPLHVAVLSGINDNLHSVRAQVWHPFHRVMRTAHHEPLQYALQARDRRGSLVLEQVDIMREPTLGSVVGSCAVKVKVGSRISLALW